MPIGHRDTFAEIQAPSSGKNSLNEDVVTWSLFEQVWVSKRLKSSSEGTAGGALSNSATYELIGDYIPGLTDDMRVEIDGIHYAIIGHESPFRSRTVIQVERTSYDRRS